MKLTSFLKKQGYDFFEKISDLTDSCCPDCTLSVLNFDKTKDKFFETLNINSNRPKSVDLLFERENELYLIEMKRKSASIDCDSFVKQQIVDGSIRSKVIDSLFTILGILGFHSMEPDYYSYFFNRKKLKVKSILLSNFTNEEYVTVSLSTLGKQNISLTYLFEGEIGIMNCEEFQNRFCPPQKPSTIIL